MGDADHAGACGAEVGADPVALVADDEPEARDRRQIGRLGAPPSGVGPHELEPGGGARGRPRWTSRSGRRRRPTSSEPRATDVATRKRSSRSTTWRCTGPPKAYRTNGRSPRRCADRAARRRRPGRSRDAGPPRSLRIRSRRRSRTSGSSRPMIRSGSPASARAISGDKSSRRGHGSPGWSASAGPKMGYFLADLAKVSGGGPASKRQADERRATQHRTSARAATHEAPRLGSCVRADRVRRVRDHRSFADRRHARDAVGVGADARDDQDRGHPPRAGDRRDLRARGASLAARGRAQEHRRPVDRRQRPGAHRRTRRAAPAIFPAPCRARSRSTRSRSTARARASGSKTARSRT